MIDCLGVGAVREGLLLRQVDPDFTKVTLEAGHDREAAADESWLKRGTLRCGKGDIGLLVTS